LHAATLTELRKTFCFPETKKCDFLIFYEGEALERFKIAFNHPIEKREKSKNEKTEQKNAGQM
jgi:hypothetical protein